MINSSSINHFIISLVFSMNITFPSTTTLQPIYTNPVYTTTYFEAPNAQFDGTASDGTIELLNYENNLDENWEISPSCSSVWIHSTLLYVENNYDFLYIGDEQFTDAGCVDKLYDTPVSVRFTSDGSINKDGFTLHWSCDQTGFGSICDSNTTVVTTPTQEVISQGILARVRNSNLNPIPSPMGIFGLFCVPFWKMVPENSAEFAENIVPGKCSKN